MPRLTICTDCCRQASSIGCRAAVWIATHLWKSFVFCCELVVLTGTRFM